MKGYKGKRLHTRVKVLLALLLAVVVAFGALEAVVFSGARTQISGEALGAVYPAPGPAGYRPGLPGGSPGYDRGGLRRTGG